MKKTQCVSALFCAALLVLAGCASTPRQQQETNAAQQQSAAAPAQTAAPQPAAAPAPAQAAVPQPIIGAEGVPQPEWVRNPGKMETADMVYFTGEGRDGKTTTARKNSAVSDAGRQAGDWKESKIAAAVKDYVDEAGETGNTQSLEALKIASVQKARANTSGIRQRETWIAADNTYVVLVSYPKADLKKDFQASLNTFVRNEGAQYADFKAEEQFKFLQKQLEDF